MGKNRIWIFVAAVCVSACGGGGGGGASPPPVGPPPPASPPPTVLSGQFKDANVSGMDFSTATESGTTDTMGTYGYRPGETVEFSVGAVMIGAAPGAAIVTPIDLVPGGTADDTEVQNIVRFLMMLDQDQDSSNGIVISQAVRDAASNWSQVDFSTGDLDNELVTIISDVASVDNRPASLPDSQTAKSHLAGTLHCAMSGFFQGEFTGGRVGEIILLVDPLAGTVLATYSGSPTEYESEASVSVDGTRAFNAVARNGSGDNIEGRFDTFDEISGVWAIGGDTGQFTASRVAPDASAVYRFTGQWFRQVVSPRLAGPLVINVDASGAVTGKCASVNEPGGLCGFAGTFDGQDFDIDVSTPEGNAAGSRAGTVDDNLFVEGTGINENGSGLRPWFAQGCRLN